MTPEAAERTEATESVNLTDPLVSLAAERFAAATTLLKQSTQASRDFFNAFFRGASPEDLTRYSPEALVALAARIHTLTNTRPNGETLVVLTDFAGSAETRNETLLVAVNDDMPFLLDSLIGEMGSRGLRVNAVFHPIMSVIRDANGLRTGLGASAKESVIVLALDPIPEMAERDQLADGVKTVFRQVRLAVRDWQKMRDRLSETIAQLKQSPPSGSAEALNESIAFLEWLGDNHFTFLGSRDYSFRDDGGAFLEPIDESGLGVLADSGARVIRRGEGQSALSPEARTFLLEAEPLIITKSNERSVVHRRVHMDYVGVRTFDSQGRLIGERRFVGLFTSSAYIRRPSDIPLLRLKSRHVLRRAGLQPDSHDGKALAHILDTYPRDEMFQVSEDELFATALGILRLGERPKVRVFLRFDRFDRFVSAFVFVPRDRYSNEVREKIHADLEAAFHGRQSAATPMLDASLLARIHYIVGRDEFPRPQVNISAIEADIRNAIRTWEDGFAQALFEAHGDEE